MSQLPSLLRGLTAYGILSGLALLAAAPAVTAAPPTGARVIPASLGARPVIPADVQEVIDRARTSRASYSVVMTVEVTQDGATATELNGEFQRGAARRVEVPLARVLSDCDTGRALTFDVAEDGLVDDPALGATACGISVDSDKVLAARRLAPIEGDYGRADVIELSGARFVRRYAVTPDGIIVGNEYSPVDPKANFAMRTVSAIVDRNPPPAALFTREALAKPAIR